jgi:hypothetical protein
MSSARGIISPAIRAGSWDRLDVYLADPLEHSVSPGVFEQVAEAPREHHLLTRIISAPGARLKSM